jgi:hypothetical protein
MDGAEPVRGDRFSPVAANGADNLTGAEGETTSATRVRQNYRLIDWRKVKAALGFSGPRGPYSGATRRRSCTWAWPYR